MKTTHQFANELLVAPDMPIVVPSSSTAEDTRTPIITKVSARDPEGKSVEVALIAGMLDRATSAE